jgi:hypothetical protein
MRRDRVGRTREERAQDHAIDGADRPGTPLAWYRWYPGDHLRVLRGWPLIARAVYRELLDAQWDLGVLSAAPERLRAIVGASEAEWRIAWSWCRRHFPRAGTGRRNPALEALRATQVALVEHRRRAGQAGNDKRWGSRATVVPLRPGRDDA